MKITARGAACILLLRACDAFAFFDNRLQLNASESLTHDDNVFRLADDVNPVPIIGSTDLSDTYRTTAVGLVFDVPTGAQTFRGNLEMNRNDFDRFTELDFNGHRAGVDWLFDGEELVKARAGYSSSRSLASFANILNGSQSTQPNIIDLSRAYANGTLALASRWLLTGEVASNTQDNSAPLYATSDLRATTERIEFAYVTPAMTKLGIGVQSIDGTLPNPSHVGPLIVNNSYVQQDAAIFFEWRPRDYSSLEARVGRMHRDYADLATRRDTSEDTYRVSYSWQPGAAVSIAALAQRGPSTIEEINVGYVLVEGAGLQTTWQLTQAASLTFDVEHGTRTYKDDPAVTLGLNPELSEHVSVFALGGAFKLSRVVSLDLRLRHERRSSSSPTGGYNVDIAGLGVRCSF